MYGNCFHHDTTLKKLRKNKKVEIGNIIELLNTYQHARVNNIPQFSYNYELDRTTNIIPLEGDYVIKLICQYINVATLE